MANSLLSSPKVDTLKSFETLPIDAFESIGFEAVAFEAVAFEAVAFEAVAFEAVSFLICSFAPPINLFNTSACFFILSVSV